jgi:hypothetical protein
LSTAENGQLSTVAQKAEDYFSKEEGDGRKFPASLTVVKGTGRHRGKTKRIISGTRSSVAQALLVHRRKPLRLDQHAFFLPVYDLKSPLMLLKCARQVAKSTTLCNLMLTESMVHEAYRTLYVSPSSMQTRQFSNEKLTPTMNDSDIVQDHFVDRNCISQVYEKTMLNGSHIFLRYAFLSADRARGIPADRLFLDEIQDILKDNVKVIAECLSFSDYGYELYAGTPKTMDNTIEEYWKWSTQMEWVVPCQRHTPVHWNVLSVENIGRKHLICDKCGEQIFPESGQWVVTNPGGEYVGFHVTQLMVPWKQDAERWRKEIIWKYENWPTAVFYNEVLGDSHDQASKPITQSELMQCCWPINKQDPIKSEHLYLAPEGTMAGRENYAGVDWGEGRSEGKMVEGKKRHASFTVLTIGTFVSEQIFWPFFIKRYEGREIDPEFIKKDITQLCFKFGVNCIGCDWGHGWGMNSHLINRLGRDKVMEFQYVAKLRQRIKWDKLAFNFKVNRSLVMAEFITACKEQNLLLPVWEEFEKFAKDILGIYIDYNERMKTMYYDHPIDQPDDWSSVQRTCCCFEDRRVGLDYDQHLWSSSPAVPG